MIGITGTLRTALGAVLLSAMATGLAVTSAAAGSPTPGATVSSGSIRSAGATATAVRGPSVVDPTSTTGADPAGAAGAAGSSPSTPPSTPPAGSAAAAPSGEAMPVGNLPGWKQIFTDDFTTDVPLGSFPAAEATKWSAYPSPWKDTSGNGTYSPAKVVSVANGVMNSDIHTENGSSMVSAMSPKLGSSMLYGRYAVRFRFDSLPGYKMAWMLWPNSDDNKTDGEIDFPEMNLDKSTAWAFVHHTNSTKSGDQAWMNTPLTPGTWHTAVIEWSPNLVVITFDGVEVGRTTDRVPSTPMHWILQTETALSPSTAPAASVRGNVQVDWVTAYSYDPTTATPARAS